MSPALRFFGESQNAKKLENKKPKTNTPNAASDMREMFWYDGGEPKLKKLENQKTKIQRYEGNVLV